MDRQYLNLRFRKPRFENATDGVCVKDDSITWLFVKYGLPEVASSVDKVRFSNSMDSPTIAGCVL